MAWTKTCNGAAKSRRIKIWQAMPYAQRVAVAVALALSWQ